MGTNDRVAHQVRRRTIDLDGLTTPTRFLAKAGYVCLAAVLLATIASKPIANTWSYVEILASFGTIRVPAAIAVVAGLAEVIGWAFLLTGATYFWKRWLAPIWALFLLVFLSQGVLVDAWRLLLVLALSALSLWVHAARGHQSRWRGLPFLEFVSWFAVATIMLAPLWLGPTDPLAVTGLETGLELIVVAALPFWVLLSVEMCELSIESGRWLVIGSRRWLGEHRAFWLTVPILLIPPILSEALVSTERWPTMFLDVMAGVVLLAAAGLLLLYRRWTARTAAALQVLSVALLILTWALSIGIGGPRDEPQDPLEWLLGWTRLPAVFLFVVALTFNLLSFGARYCNGESAHMPRRGRVLAYFGFDLLVCSALLLLVNARDPTGNLPTFVRDLTTAVAGLGVLFFGFPYFLWLLLRRREKVFGDATAV